MDVLHLSLIAGGGFVLVALASFAIAARSGNRSRPNLPGVARPPSKIERIKRYRELHGVGLKEAKDAIEAEDRREFVAPPPAARPTSPSMAQVEALLAADNLIGAIKAYRELTGVGLKEAKDAVERLRDKR